MKSLVGASKNIINVTSQFEQTQKALETVTQSAEKGKELFEELRKFSFDTTFGVDELASASSQLLNVGVSSSRLKKDLKMLGDLAQGDKMKFQELTSIFAKVQSTGKASSMQLQQFALRGIPITQKLKEMGVKGVASAEQLTKAFEELTGVGGQFHDAMGNIIDTIEGKKGFISDTLKEIAVNFGEVSGFTELYKKALDKVYDILDKVNNKLIEWKSNPMMQAVLRGGLVAGISALTMAIGVGLVGAITKLNASLAITATLKALINPTGVALAIGVSAITGLAVALESAKDSAGDYYKEIKKIDELKNKYGVGDVNMKEARDNVQKGRASTKEKLAVAVEDLQSSEARKAEYAIQVRDAKYADVKKNAQADLDYENKIYETTLKQVEALKEQLRLEEEKKSKTKTIKELYTEQQDEYNKVLKSLGSAYEKYSESAKKEKELTELETDRKKLLDDFNKTYHGFDSKGVAMKLTFDEEAKKKFEQDLKAIEDKKHKLEIEIEVSKQTEWQKKLQSAFGFTGQEVYDGATKTTEGAFAYFEKMNGEMQKLYEKYGVKDSSYSSSQQYYNAMKKAFDSVLESVRDKTYTGDEASLTKFAEAVKKAEENIYKDLQKTNKQYRDILNSTDSRKKQLVKIYALEHNISEESAELLVKEEEENKKLLERADILKNIENLWEQVAKGDISQLGNAMIAEGGNMMKDGNMRGVGQFIGGSMFNQMMSASGDASNFASGFSQGGVLGGVISTLIGAFTNVAKGAEKFEKVMNPITEIMKVAKKPIHEIINILGKFVEASQVFGLTIRDLFNGIMPIFEIANQTLNEFTNIIFMIVNQAKPLYSVIKLILNLVRMLIFPIHAVTKGIEALISFLQSIPFLGDFVDGVESFANDLDKSAKELYESIDKQIDEQTGIAKAREEAQALANEDLNNTVRDLTGEYKSLLDAMKENEEWYLRQKTALNANTRKDYYSVNDMILTPQGQFSTHPDDYIIATKNPKSLGGGCVVNMKINNTVANDVEVSAQAQDNGSGGQDILVMISRKIASDVANGANGWDSATSGMNTRLAGRRVLI